SDTVTGTYSWSASYAGDGANTGSTDQGGPAEQTVVSPASPTLVTTASGAVTLDATGAPTLKDTADLEGGYFPTGTIAFTLTLNGNPVSAASQTDTVTGNGTYCASYKLPTTGAVAGTYLWHAVYTSGDGNNLGTDDTKSA